LGEGRDGGEEEEGREFGWHGGDRGAGGKSSSGIFH
jgi:hypothetical protein